MTVQPEGAKKIGGDGEKCAGEGPPGIAGKRSRSWDRNHRAITYWELGEYELLTETRENC